MPNVDFQYVIDLTNAKGAPLGQTPVHPDWTSARHWVRMEAVRQGRVGEGEIPGAVVVHPVWSASGGRPQVEGFRFEITGGAGDGFFVTAGVEYLQNWAEVSASALVQSNQLERGESYRYQVFAFPEVKGESTQQMELAPFEEPPISFGLTDRSLNDLGAISGEEEYPVFFPRQIIGETEELTEGAGGKETGGLLVGKLFRDPGQSVIFAEVTAQIPARHVEASETNLAFTSETWSQARSALRLRKKNETFLGWWHSHPVKEWCKACPAEKRKKCPLLVDFFSLQDRHLHQTAFPGAHSIALVVNQLASDHQTISLFGWSRGVLSQRKYQVLDPSTTEPKKDPAANEAQK